MATSSRKPKVDTDTPAGAPAGTPIDAPGAAGEGMDHLQRAAREMVAAARSFLDAVDGVIADDDRFAGAASRVADILSTLGGALNPQEARRSADSDGPKAATSDGRVRRIVVE